MDVQAESHEAAVEMGIRAAASVPDAEWRGSFEPGIYTYSVECVLDSREAEADTVDASDDPLDLSFADEDTRYLVLQADVATGEGDLPEQPWIKREKSLLIRDLVCDWAASLEEFADQLIAARRLREEIVEALVQISWHEQTLPSAPCRR